jgi:alanine racemase
MLRAEVDIDLHALRHNVAAIALGTNAQILAVVKANAYGHGLIPVAKTAIEAGAHWLGVALLEEGVALRAAGITAPTIAWLTPPGSDFAQALELGIDLSVPSLEILQEISIAARSLKKVARIHLEIDTGMHRGGVLGDWVELVNAIKAAPVEVIGAWSHFARADEPENVYTELQSNNFNQRLQELTAAGITPEFSHLANSAAVLAHGSTHKDIVRLGIAMYGLSPDVLHMGSGESLGLKPVMTLHSILHSVKKVPAGSPVGYGGVGVTTMESFLGIVPLGYSDGIPRNATSAVGVTINGKKAPIIGRVSMDQLVVDLGPDSQAKAGDKVTLFGEGSYSIDEWAAACGTINYEIVTRIAARVPRISV